MNPTIQLERISIQIFYVFSDSWSSTEVQPMRDRRSFPCAVVCEDEMFVMGGYDGNDTLRTVEAYSFEVVFFFSGTKGCG